MKNRTVFQDCYYYYFEFSNFYVHLVVQGFWAQITFAIHVHIQGSVYYTRHTCVLAHICVATENVGSNYDFSLKLWFEPTFLVA